MKHNSISSHNPLLCENESSNDILSHKIPSSKRQPAYFDIFSIFSPLYYFSVLLLSNHHFLDCFGALLLVGNRTVKCSIHELKVKVYLKQVGSSTDLVENRGQNGIYLRLLYLDKRIEFVEFKKLPISNLDFVGGQRGWQIWQQKQLRHCVSFLVLKMFYTRYEI